jgi:hypothetical protein
MDYINGIPFRWDAVEDNALLGGLFGKTPALPSNDTSASSPAIDNTLFTEQGTINNIGEFPQPDSPFGDNSIFSQEADKGYVIYVDFKKLIPAIEKHQGAIMHYYFSDYQSKGMIPIGFPPFGSFDTPPDNSGEKSSQGEQEDENPVLKKVKEIIRDVAPRNRVDKEYVDEQGKLVFLDGKLNVRKGYIKIDKKCIGFQFELNASKRIIRFIDHFHYINPQTEEPLKEWAIHIEAFRYEDYLGLCKAEGLYLYDSSRARITKEFFSQLAEAKDKPAMMAWLYFKMPDFVFAKMEKSQLVDGLTTILKGGVQESVVNEEVIVLNILKAFVTDKKEDQDYLLTQLTTRFIGKETLFEVLYIKMNNFAGKDNWTAAIQLLYKIWSVSKFADDTTYTYSGQPEILAYQSEKIMGFYQSGFDFSFKNNKIEVQRDTDTYLGEGAIGTEKVHFTTYEFLQPIQLQEVDQEGDLKIQDIIPAFYLKAFDDKNKWANFEKTAWIVLDVIMTFTAVGNLLKLRYLKYLPKRIFYLRVFTGTLFLTSSVVHTMLNFVNNCAGDDFCRKLQKYLFWLDLVTISVDAITERMLRKSAREALEEMSDDLRKLHPDIKKHLDEIAAGERGFLESKSLTENEISLWASKIKKANAELKFVEENLAIKTHFDKHNIGAAFEATAIPPTIWVRKGVTDFELFHESKHLEELNIIGRDQYMKGAKEFGGTFQEDLIRKYKREKYVYSEILKEQKLSNRFTEQEIKFTKKYFTQVSLDCIEAGIDISKF